MNENQNQTQAFKKPPSIYKDHSSDPIYRNFVNSLRSPITKRGYSQSLNKYYLSRPENQNLSLSEIISKNPKTIEYELIDLIYEMREKKGLAYSTIHNVIAALTHFFEMNDVVINKKKLIKFKGENIAKFEYRGYTVDEINQLLTMVDERAKTSILLMASTGMRVGGLVEIRLKHLKRWNLDSIGNHIYQITVYANSPKHKYQTFCTPEAAKAIDFYLNFRKRHGDNLKQDPQTGNWSPGESFLFIRNFDKENQDMFGMDKLTLMNLGVTPKSITRGIISGLEKLGLRNRLRLVEEQATTDSEKRAAYARHKNELHPCHSLRIFAVTAMQRSKVDKTIREMLVGHATGLDKVYYKPQDDEILQEYLKAVDLLTINNEFRLQKQVDYYKERESDLSRMSLELAEIRQKLGI